MTTSAIVITLGSTTITLADGSTVTQFGDGSVVHAAHEDVGALGQAQTALTLGYASISAMNREHDREHEEAVPDQRLY